MKYGQIAGNSKINAFIYRCFEYICEEDERKFVKKFREQPHESDEVMHTFRELVLGAFLSSRGLRARHEHLVCGRTPDWSILNDDSMPVAIVELTNFHVDKATETKIQEQRREKGLACVWRDANTDNVDRLYHSLWRKAQTYRALAQELEIAYIVALLGEIEAAVDEEEVRYCLFDEEFGLFERYPEVSGVLYFEEQSGHYLFRYIHNPIARFDMLSGAFPPDRSAIDNSKATPLDE